MTYQIAIVGGGLAGLAVAHALGRAKREGRARNLTVTVYEQREDEPDIQRYPVHLNADGRSALGGILGARGYKELVEVAEQGTDHGGISIFTPALSGLFHVQQYRRDQPQFVHRWVLKQILSHQVDIVRGRRVRTVNETSDGVKIMFEDGAAETADLVIGADGVGSSLRAQIYPDYAKFEKLPFINIQMKLSTLPNALPTGFDTRGINTVLGTDNYSLLLVPFHGQSLPLTAESHACSDIENQDVLKALDQHRPEFLFAILTVRCFEGWEDLTSNEWQTKTVDLLNQDRAHPSLIEIFKSDVIRGTVGQPWQVVSCDPRRPVPYAGGRVILIGDAVHVMPPQAGAGASNALMDGYQLSEVILSSFAAKDQNPRIIAAGAASRLSPQDDEEGTGRYKRRKVPTLLVEQIRFWCDHTTAEPADPPPYLELYPEDSKDPPPIRQGR